MLTNVRPLCLLSFFFLFVLWHIVVEEGKKSKKAKHKQSKQKASKCVSVTPGALLSDCYDRCFICILCVCFVSKGVEWSEGGNCLLCLDIGMSGQQKGRNYQPSLSHPVVEVIESLVRFYFF